MQKRPAAIAFGIAVTLASCVQVPTMVTPTVFRTMGTQVQAEGYYRQPDLADFLGNARQHAADTVRSALGQAGILSVSPGRVTGSGTINTGTPILVTFTVNVTQGTSGSPTGSVTIRQNAPPPYLQSNRITSATFNGPNVSISGTLQGGGSFTFRGTQYPPGVPDYVEVYTPYFAAGGPVNPGGITIQD